MMRRGALFVATLILLGGMGQARAGSMLDFNLDPVHPVGASISYAGGANPLVGSDLSVDSVFGLGTPLNDLSMLGLTGGLLNFQPGNLTGSDPDDWFFGGGGDDHDHDDGANRPGGKQHAALGHVHLGRGGPEQRLVQGVDRVLLQRTG